MPKALEESIDFSKFKCEKQNLTDYLRSTALEDDKNNIAKVWVFVIEKEVIAHIDNEPIIKICVSTRAWKACDS